MEVKHLDPNELERWERIDGIIYDIRAYKSAGVREYWIIDPCSSVR